MLRAINARARTLRSRMSSTSRFCARPRACRFVGSEDADPENVGSGTIGRTFAPPAGDAVPSPRVVQRVRCAFRVRSRRSPAHRSASAGHIPRGSVTMFERIVSGVIASAAFTLAAARPALAQVSVEIGATVGYYSPMGSFKREYLQSMDLPRSPSDLDGTALGGE